MLLHSSTYYFFAAAGLARNRWLQSMRLAGRLGVLLGPAVQPGRVQQVGLVVFRSADLRKVLTFHKSGDWAQQFENPVVGLDT